MIKRRLALLALEGVLLLTACGQTKDISTLTTPPPQSAAQVIAPVEDKAEMPQKEEKPRAVRTRRCRSSGQMHQRMRITPQKNSLHPLKRHRPLHRKSRRHPRLCRRINLLPHPHRHLHRHRQRNRNKQGRKSPPNLRPRRSLPPAGTSTPSRRLSGRATSTQERSTA